MAGQLEEEGEFLFHGKSAEDLTANLDLYNDSGASQAFIKLRESEKQFAKKLSTSNLYATKEYHTRIDNLLRGWLNYSKVAGGEHYGPVLGYAQRRILLMGDTLSGRSSSEGLAKILDENPVDTPLDSEETERYKKYLKGLGEVYFCETHPEVKVT